MLEYVMLVGFYKTSNKKRNKEIIFCLEENSKHEFLKEIVVFNETDTKPLESDKITYVNVDKRLTYKQYFQYANEKHSGSRCIIVNADIILTEDIRKLDCINIKRAFVCLTRWDSEGDKLQMGADSQDTWIFEAPANEQLVISADYNLGVLFSDNVLSLLAYRSGYMPFNPAQDIVTKHVHGSDFRNPSKEAAGKALDVTNGDYMFVHPNKIGEQVNADFMTHA
tara:strand:+ start:2376 stop:3047 length:672 start_codon:yes stop_codon:yes gene_type:complete